MLEEKYIFYQKFKRFKSRVDTKIMIKTRLIRNHETVRLYVAKSCTQIMYPIHDLISITTWLPHSTIPVW